jgi:hypothetical protein
MSCAKQISCSNGRVEAGPETGRIEGKINHSIQIQKRVALVHVGAFKLHTKELAWTYGEQEELIQLVVFFGKRINYEYSTISIYARRISRRSLSPACLESKQFLCLNKRQSNGTENTD